MSTPFRSSLPDRPDLEQQKTRARELLRAFLAGESEATARVRAVLPDKTRVVLGDAQHVVAREYGFDGWSALRDYIAERTRDPRPPLERWRTAVQRGDAGGMRRLLEAHAEVRAAIDDTAFSFGGTALTHLAGRGDPKLVDVLLEFGADPNRRSDWWAGGFHVLHGARGAVAERLLAGGATPDACGAASLDRIDLLRTMLEEDPARVHERGGDGQTPLHFARSRDVVDLLLRYGADIDVRDVDHRATPAQWMLDRRRGAGRYELAGYLVERGADADIFLAAALGLTARVHELVAARPELLDLRTGQGEYGEKPPSSFHIYTWTIGQNLSPVQVAQQFDQRDTAAALLALASPAQRFVHAAARGDLAGARALLRDQPGLLDTLRPEDSRALADAAWNADHAAVETMLELGFDPAQPGANGGPALHCAAWEGSAEIVAAILRHRDARKLLTLRDHTYSGTALGWCCHGSLHCGNPRRAHETVARMLLEAGADAGTEPIEASPGVRGVIEAWRIR